MPPPVGGATVLFDQLVEGLLAREGISVCVINTSPRRSGRFWRVAEWLWVIGKIAIEARRYDVVCFHASLTGALLLGNWVRVAARASGKKWLFRGFGGGYVRWWQAVPRWRRWLFRHGALAADCILFESKALVEFFAQEIQQPVRWFPNNRPLEACSDVVSNCGSGFKLCFIGHVKESKGVLVLLDAARKLSSEVQIDVFGPLHDGFTAAMFDGSRVKYKGALEPEEVAGTLSAYDAFVFPTFYEGEGYPGVILEAFSAGKPVITTNWRAIPELVDDTCGCLVPVRDSAALVDAINHLVADPARLNELGSGARKRAELFSAERWHNVYLDLCASIVNPCETET